MLRAHRQAWAWQDEWHGLTMEDIREIERQTQLALKRKMGQIEDEIGTYTFFISSYFVCVVSSRWRVYFHNNVKCLSFSVF